MELIVAPLSSISITLVGFRMSFCRRNCRLCLDAQGEFALPARDYCVVARVTGFPDMPCMKRVYRDK